MPLSPLEAEGWGRGRVDAVSWFWVGLASRKQGVLIVLPLAAATLAFIYGVDMKGTLDRTLAHPDAEPPHQTVRPA